MSLNEKSVEVLLSLKQDAVKDEFSYLDSVLMQDNNDLVTVLKSKQAERELKKFEAAADHILDLIDAVDKAKLQQRASIRSLRKQVDDRKEVLKLLEAATTYGMHSNDFSVIIDMFGELPKLNMDALRKIAKRMQASIAGEQA